MANRETVQKPGVVQLLNPDHLLTAWPMFKPGRRRAGGLAQVPVDDLQPGEPERDHGDLEGLKASIYQLGLLQPIVVARDRRTVLAGRRRVAALRELPIGNALVPCLVRDDGGAAERFCVAIAENIHRKAMTDMEMVTWIAQFDEEMRRQHGERPKGGRPRTGHTVTGSWSQEKTAEALSIKPGVVKKAIKINGIVRRYPQLARLNGQAAIHEAERLDAARSTHTRATRDPGLILGDARDAIRSLRKQSVQLVMTDPPYGIAYKSASKDPQFSSRIAGDDAQAGELLEAVLECLIPKLAEDAHCYIFTKLGASYDLLKPVIDGAFTVHGHLVWTKGTSGPGTHWFAPTSEVIVFGTRGKRPRKLFGTRLPDSFTRPRLPSSARIHPTEKPPDILVPLIGRSTVPGELVADPFSGSGSTLIAAKQSGRRYWGAELEKRYYNQAQQRLRETELVEKDIHDLGYGVDIHDLGLAKAGAEPPSELDTYPSIAPPERIERRLVSFDESMGFLNDAPFRLLAPGEFEQLQAAARG